MQWLSRRVVAVVLLAAGWALGIGSILPTPATGQPAAQWSTAQLSQARGDLVAGVVGSQAVFAGGSLGGRDNYSDAVDIYDATTGQWSSARLSAPRRVDAMATVGSQILFAGGQVGTEQYSAVVDIYDAATGGWSAATLSEARHEMTVAKIGTRALFLGGARSSDRGPFGPPREFSAAVDIYDAATGQWSTATLSEHLSRPQAATVGTQVLVAANRTSLLPGGRVSDRVDIYDAATGQWSRAALSQARQAPGVATVGTRVLFAGGELEPRGPYSDVVDIYDAATGQWSTATLSVARAAPFPATVGSLVLFAGGTLGRTPPNDAVTSDRIDLYDSATGAWSTATLSRSGGQSLPRWGFAVAQVGTQVLFAGGFTGARMGLAQSRVVDIYDAASGQWTTGELSVVLPEGERLSVAEVGTRALFAGGSGVDIYDSTTGRWSTARLSQRRVRMAVATVGNRVLLAGGAAIDIYDSPPRP